LLERPQTGNWQRGFGGAVCGLLAAEAIIVLYRGNFEADCQATVVKAA